MRVDEPADLVFKGGTVFAAGPNSQSQSAVAVQAGRVVGVGTDNDMAAMIGPRTEVVDLAGRMLVPGFQDAHVHPPSAGLDRLRCDLSDLHSRNEYLERIRGYASSHLESEWVLGGGWAIDVFPGGTPLASDLDVVVPDRPAFFSNRDNHGAWVNSRALELARIDRDTPDPVDGRFERDDQGNPTGTLHEGAMLPVQRVIPPATFDEQVKGALLAQDYLHSLGITAWQDAIVGEYATMPDSFDTYLHLAERGDLTARVVGALWLERDLGVEQIDGLLDRRSRGRVGRFQATSIKIMQDGICENFTAAVLSPYLDASGAITDNCGISFFPPEELNEIVTRLDAEGFQVHFHAIGERGVREGLDALEAAQQANGTNDNRHHMAHIQVVHPDDLPRFARLGVTANAQPLWASNEPAMVELNVPFLGNERSTWQYPFAELVQSGARLAFGSDWPVSSPDPLWGMHVAVNRTVFEGYPYGTTERALTDPLLPHQRIDIETALAAYTRGSAFVNHLDQETGSIEEGKAADLVVLDQNLFEVDSSDIAEVKVLLTLIDGRPVFESSDL